MKPPLVLAVLELVVVLSFTDDSCALIVLVVVIEVVAEDIVLVPDDSEDIRLVVSKVKVGLWVVLDSLETLSDAEVEKDGDCDEEEEEGTFLSEEDV